MNLLKSTQSIVKPYYLPVAINACGIYSNPGTLQEIFGATPTCCRKYLLHPVTVALHTLHIYCNDYLLQPGITTLL